VGSGELEGRSVAPAARGPMLEMEMEDSAGDCDCGAVDGLRDDGIVGDVFEVEAVLDLRNFA
jgi:hypothetical protein